MKLINNGYIHKDIFNKDISFKKRRKYNNTKSRNIYNGKNTDMMVMHILWEFNWLIDNLLIWN